MNGPCIDSWWDHDEEDPRGRTKRPSRCSCCRKLTRRQVEEHKEEYLCPVHGVAVVAEWESKRSGKAAWHYYRYFSETTLTHVQQLGLFK